MLQIYGVDINMDPQVETEDKKHTPTAGSGGCIMTQDREEVAEQPYYNSYMLKTHKDTRYPFSSPIYACSAPLSQAENEVNLVGIKRG